MLIIPKLEKKISSVSQFDNIKEVKRNIMIYTSDPLNQSKQSIAIINNCIQYGSIGAIQSDSETLYSVNCYYGTVDSPMFINPVSKKIDINPEAVCLISDNGYVYKMIDESSFIPDIQTVNWFSGEFNSDYAMFKNAKYIDFREILPSDPRYYNLDQQIKMTDCTHPFYADDLDLGPCESEFHFLMRSGQGIPFRLGDLIDSYTTIRALDLSIDDPYRIISDDIKMKMFINGVLTRIVNYGMLMLAKEFTVILDKQLGYNALNMRRSFNNIERKYEQADIKKFYYNLKIEYENLMDSPYNIRITIKFDEFKTYLQILPTDNSINEINGHFSRNKLEQYIEDTYNEA